MVEVNRSLLLFSQGAFVLFFAVACLFEVINTPHTITFFRKASLEWASPIYMLTPMLHFSRLAFEVPLKCFLPPTGPKPFLELTKQDLFWEVRIWHPQHVTRPLQLVKNDYGSNTWCCSLLPGHNQFRKWPFVKLLLVVSAATCEKVDIDD